VFTLYSKTQAPIDNTSLKAFAAIEFKIFSGIQPRQGVILMRLYAQENFIEFNNVRLNNTAKTDK
jgi:hypothetical protein